MLSPSSTGKISVTLLYRFPKSSRRIENFDKEEFATNFYNYHRRKEESGGPRSAMDSGGCDGRLPADADAR